MLLIVSLVKNTQGYWFFFLLMGDQWVINVVFETGEAVDKTVVLIGEIQLSVRPVVNTG